MSHDNSSLVIARSIAQCVYSLIVDPQFRYQGKSLEDWAEFLHEKGAITSPLLKIWHGALTQVALPHLPLSSNISSIGDITLDYIMLNIYPFIGARQQRILDRMKLYKMLNKHGKILIYYVIDWSRLSAPDQLIKYKQQLIAHIIRLDRDGIIHHSTIGTNRYGESLFAISMFGQLKNQLHQYVGESVNIDAIIRYAGIQDPSAIVDNSIPQNYIDGYYIEDLKDSVLKPNYV